MKYKVVILFLILIFAISGYYSNRLSTLVRYYPTPDIGSNIKPVVDGLPFGILNTQDPEIQKALLEADITYFKENGFDKRHSLIHMVLSDVGVDWNTERINSTTDITYFITSDQRKVGIPTKRTDTTTCSVNNAFIVIDISDQKFSKLSSEEFKKDFLKPNTSYLGLYGNDFYEDQYHESYCPTIFALQQSRDELIINPAIMIRR